MMMLDIQQDGEGVRIQTGARLDAEAVGTRWPAITAKIDRLSPTGLTVDASDLESIDGAGIAFLLTLQRHVTQQQGQFSMEGLKPDFQKLLDSNTLEGLVTTAPPKASFRRIAEDVLQEPVSTAAVFPPGQFALGGIRSRGLRLAWSSTGTIDFDTPVSKPSHRLCTGLPPAIPAR